MSTRSSEYIICLRALPVPRITRSFPSLFADEALHRVHVARIPKKVNNHDALGSVCDFAPDKCWINSIMVMFNINDYWNKIVLDYDVQGGDKSDRRD